jgi:hypothetical protein
VCFVSSWFVGSTAFTSAIATIGKYRQNSKNNVKNNPNDPISVSTST